MNTTADRFQSSPLQEALWLAQPDGPTGATQVVLCRRSGFDATAVQTALRSSVERHEVLRTTFARQAGVRVPLQAVNSMLEPEFSSDSSDARAVAERELATAFDFEQGPLLRGVLAGSGEHQALVLTASGLIADASSIVVLARELMAALGGGGELVEEPLQYADYAAWQHELAEGTDPERQAAVEFWNDVADSAAPHLAFTDATAEPGASRWLDVPVDESVAQGLAAAAGRYGTSVSVVVLAGWLALLGRSTGEESVTVSWVTSERRHADLDGAIGAFCRPVPVGARVAGVTFAEVLQEVQRATQRALVVQDYAPTDGAGNSSLGFICEAAIAGEVSGHTRTRPGSQPRLWVAAGDDGADGIRLGFDSAYLAGAQAEQLASRLGTLLTGVAADPSMAVASLPLLDAPAREQVLSQFGEGPAVAVGSDQLVHERVAVWASREPARIAVADEQGNSYLCRARRAGWQAGGPPGQGRRWGR